MGEEQTWPKCGHPKTAENTRGVGVGRFACRECRRQIDARRIKQQKESPK